MGEAREPTRRPAGGRPDRLRGAAIPRAGRCCYTTTPARGGLDERPQLQPAVQPGQQRRLTRGGHDPEAMLLVWASPLGPLEQPRHPARRAPTVRPTGKEKTMTEPTWAQMLELDPAATLLGI